MNDFDYDAMQKKRIARGAYNRVTHSGCSLPSDNLTDAQKRRLNGPITTFNLNEPMSWSDFKALKHEHQELYLRHMRNFYNATDGMLAEMFGLSTSGVCKYTEKHDLPRGTRGQRPTDSDLLTWRMFRAGQLPLQKTDEGIEDTPATVEEPEKSIEDTPIEEKVDSTEVEKPIENAEKCESVNYLLQFNGVPEWESIFDVLKNLPLDHAKKVEVKVWA